MAIADDLRPQVTPWPESERPTEAEVRRRISAEGLTGYVWSNSPRDTYSAHRHAYDKVIYVLRGSITFGLPKTGDRLHLTAGARLFLPAQTQHDAVVGDDGVVCFEAHLPG